MQDKKVIESLREMDEQDVYNLTTYHTNPLLFFAEAVSLTRKEPGVSIEKIALCFRHQFDESELSSLIHELNKGKI